MLCPLTYKVYVTFQKANNNENRDKLHYPSFAIHFRTMSNSVVTVYFVHILADT